MDRHHHRGPLAAALQENSSPEINLITILRQGFYSEVYKLINPLYNSVAFKAYFKKGIGFLYFEKDSMTSNGYYNYKAYMIQ